MVEVMAGAVTTLSAMVPGNVVGYLTQELLLGLAVEWILLEEGLTLPSR